MLKIMGKKIFQFYTEFFLFINMFSSETTWQIALKFHMETH